MSSAWPFVPGMNNSWIMQIGLRFRFVQEGVARYVWGIIFSTTTDVSHQKLVDGILLTMNKHLKQSIYWRTDQLFHDTEHVDDHTKTERLRSRVWEQHNIILAPSPPDLFDVCDHESLQISQTTESIFFWTRYTSINTMGGCLDQFLPRPLFVAPSSFHFERKIHASRPVPDTSWPVKAPCNGLDFGANYHWVDRNDRRVPQSRRTLRLLWIENHCKAFADKNPVSGPMGRPADQVKVSGGR